jgi:hypothetical protein
VHLSPQLDYPPLLTELRAVISSPAATGGASFFADTMVEAGLLLVQVPLFSRMLGARIKIIGVSHILPGWSNSPTRAPARNAFHSPGVNRRTGMSAFLQSWMPIMPSGRAAISTQLPLARLGLLLTPLGLVHVLSPSGLPGRGWLPGRLTGWGRMRRSRPGSHDRGGTGVLFHVVPVLGVDVAE